MRLILNSKFSSINKGSVVTIGNFDGVHLGHQALLKKLSIKKRELKLPAVVVLFEPQPAEFFLKENAPARLSSLRDKAAKIKDFNIDFIYCLKFNHDLALMAPEKFVNDYIFSRLKSRYLIVGSDFKFGHDRSGNVTLLKKISHENDCELEVYNDIELNNSRISSTKIRQDLKKGDLLAVEKGLGNPYWLCARVIKGAGRGRKWGIPTANLKLQRNNLPLNGVFCVKVKTENADWTKIGVANVGTRPTVDGLQNLLEIHLIDENISLYGQRLKVFFMHKLRDEVKFSSVDELIVQIKQDIADTRNYFRVTK